MVGWRDFDESMPNRGHFALAALEQHNKIGAVFDDRPEYYDSQERFNFILEEITLRVLVLGVWTEI